MDYWLPGRTKQLPTWTLYRPGRAQLRHPVSPHIHDLVELARLCTDYEASFSTIQPYCVSLNPYGVQVRYPNELAVDDSIAGQAIDYAEKIFEFCEKLINDMG
jgi:HEPN domain-containing protein